MFCTTFANLPCLQLSLWVADSKFNTTSSRDQICLRTPKLLICLYTIFTMADYSTCISVLPRSLSSACMVVDGKTMLCGRIGLITAGPFPTGLDGAYDRYFRGGMGTFCCGKAGINKNCKMAYVHKHSHSKLACIQM